MSRLQRKKTEVKKVSPKDGSTKKKDNDFQNLELYREQRGTCSVCGEDAIMLVNLSRHCNHAPISCILCHKKSISTEVQSKGQSTFKCISCDRKYAPKEYMALLDKRLAHIVDNLLLNKTLEQCEEFRWCKSSKGCGAGQLVANHSDLHGYYTCYSCSQMLCFKHSIEWHSGFTCDEFDAEKARNPDFASDATVKEFTKQCPNEACKTPIMKLEGCDVMTCCRFGTHVCAESEDCDHGGRNYCGQRFCWSCLGKIDVDASSKTFIRHCKSTCQYYSLN